MIERLRNDIAAQGEEIHRLKEVKAVSELEQQSEMEKVTALKEELEIRN